VDGSQASALVTHLGAESFPGAGRGRVAAWGTHWPSPQPPLDWAATLRKVWTNSRMTKLPWASLGGMHQPPRADP
jgi:hypothetical protein